jgi:tyrosinase
VPHHPVPFASAVLEFEDLKHDGPSYHVLLYLNKPDADQHTGRDAPEFAGEFTVFAHGDCWGDPGHCDVPKDPLHAFDKRPPHQLTPINVTVDVTKPLQRVTNEQVAVTALAFPVAGAERDEPLRFAQLTLVTFD